AVWVYLMHDGGGMVGGYPSHTFRWWLRAPMFGCLTICLEPSLGFEIEELADGKVAVFLPSVPAATIGQVQLVPRERVHPLQASMHATLEALTMFGVGSSKLVGRDPEAGPGEE
ncbi:MAG: hypothetical protein QGI77_12225, partial [Roseibacillus sp.]|nr:hypothetical protein [Roseibacillus sp.]